MIKTKIIKSLPLLNYSTEYKASIVNIGLFDTQMVKFDYYAILIKDNNAILPHLTSSTNFAVQYDVNNIKTYGRKYSSPDECNSFLERFKTVWESGSNDDKSITRDKKIKDILDNE